MIAKFFVRNYHLVINYLSIIFFFFFFKVNRKVNNLSQFSAKSIQSVIFHVKLNRTVNTLDHLTIWDNVRNHSSNIIQTVNK